MRGDFVSTGKLTIAAEKNCGVEIIRPDRLRTLGVRV